MRSRSPVVAATEKALSALFPVDKPLIGTIHLEPLPGAPRYDGMAIRDIARRAVEDAQRYVDGGIDGLIVENEGDVPFLTPDQVGHEAVAAMAVVTAAVVPAVPAVPVPVGVLCLATATPQSISIAQAGGARFVRANQWANAPISLRYRAVIGAKDVRVFADVHVEHGSHAIVVDRSVAELTHDTVALDADVLIATGQRTGDPTTVEEVEQIARVASRPVLVGSGLDAENAEPSVRGRRGHRGQCNERGRRMVEPSFRRADPGDRPRRTESAGMGAGVLLLDSAELSDARAAAASGVVVGVATNPALLRAASHGQDHLSHPSRMLEAFPTGRVFLRLHARDHDAALVQASVAGHRLRAAVTAPWSVLKALMRDGLTDPAVEEFHSAVPS